jgi:DNA-binding CsgD family transcriptional regulator/pimeloyl-ACP methyl ester carboxylesterase
MSTRGLPEDHVLDDYVTDLGTVVDHLGLGRFVLYGGPLMGHVAVRYSVKHPERVAALILGDATISRAWGSAGFDELARRDWDTFLHILASSFSLDGAPLEVPYWRESLSREDYFRQSAAARASDIGPLLSKLRVPTLIVNARILRQGEPETFLAEDGRTMAATIPDARLILYDGFAGVLYSEGSESPPFVRYVEDFLAEAVRHDREPPGPLPARLTPREIEVLRFVAEGRTNREIAERLVISERTVINHLSNIFTKTGAENRAAATAFALRHRLV